ncbi:putative Malectin/receptor protein kinase family protein [Hibiscus syriacus]|uniref:Malectin/receptor protein kinase family protein n=1 Tax=Hibiscus syriacus TaxID=106335 RepID=A0A6A3A4D3_HIBSY|nr:receptor-like protein kinase FERONIA [Hibiscus syriacus]KAE8699180.1 putative Malectin/receptor protein kinase family protein [Hibiscus syriacus]
MKPSSMSEKSKNTTRSSIPSKFGMFLSSFIWFLVVTHTISVEAVSSYDCSSFDEPSSHASKVYGTNPGNSEKLQPCVTTKKHPLLFQFPVSPGPNLIRLHFNPFSYSGFNISKALFSVSAAHFTLLKTSTASYSKCLPDDCYIVTEFCIDVDDQELNVTFTPSPDVADAYAFVNKIQVVSMPSNLYIREVVSLPLIGQPSPYYIKNSTALEMMYRLNVGGDLIPEQEDTGMLRKWVSDESFLTTDKSNRELYPSDEYRYWLPTVILSSNVQIKPSSTMSAYVAPGKVYASARTVAYDASNQNGATWLLPVDSGFYYLVRLHFCEISNKIKGVGQRVFHVYIEDQTAEDKADIFLWSHGVGVPVYRDYVVYFAEHAKRGTNLSVSIRNSNGSIEKSMPAILNGLEIFKLSNFNNSLAGSFSFGIGKYSNPLTRHGGNYLTVVISGRIFISILVLTTLWQLVVSCWRRQREIFLQSHSSDHFRCFSFDEVKLATNNFSAALLLGTGGYGKVYKGFINGGTDIVAIKRANPRSHQGLNEFQTEIFLLSQLRHCHLVSLIGSCKEKKEMILMYDYMANGTLRDHLYNMKKPLLPWTRRLAICIGAARGLHYLHTSSKHCIIHRDVKSTNILLDQNWVAKVSDFGLSKIGPNMLTQSNTHVSTMVKGNFGYLDPEYYKRQKLTEKSDVYSFGVVLFEVLCARPAILQGTEHLEEEQEKINLAEWALHCYQSGRLDEIVDPYLQGAIDPTCLTTFTGIARKCLCDKGIERPTMGEVLWNLEQAWLQQESACLQNNGDGGAADESSAIIDVNGAHLEGTSDLSPGVEFSEIIAPIGR